MLALHFKQYGNQGNPLIILHGFLGSLDNWHSIANYWAEQGMQVFSLDQRNHGRSPHTPQHSIGLMADDLLAFMNDQQLEKAFILGHSMGGKVAMEFSLRHPDRVRGLIVADIAPVAYQHGAHDAVFRAIFNIDLARIENRKQAEEAMMPYLGDFGTRQFILKSLDRTPEGFKWKFNIDTLHAEYDEVLRAISNDTPFMKPACFVRGGQSRYIKDEDIPSIQSLFPQASLITIDHAGHWIHADQPIPFRESVLHFIQSNT